MQVLSEYIRKHSLYPAFIQDSPAADLFTIIVIPCFNESGVISALESLKNCIAASRPVEIIVVINHATETIEAVRRLNLQTAQAVKKWIAENNTAEKRFFLIEAYNMPPKDAGVGLARKIGMDEAVLRFVQANNERGIILGFDADCSCDSNYIQEIESKFLKSDQLRGASVYFEHPVSGNEFDLKVYHAIIRYELHLRYYRQALDFAGFPFAFHTVGSSFAVRAEAYCMQGGMSKRKAGEDFYFLSKVIPHGHYAEINSTRVIPSSRYSDRVPFGTGAAVGKILQDEKQEFYSYPLELFNELKLLFSKLDQLFVGKIDLDGSTVLSRFLISTDFEKDLKEIQKNTSSFDAFYKRFFQKFNAFKILKFLNFAVSEGTALVPIQQAAENLLKSKGFVPGNGLMSLLEEYRKIDKCK